MNSIIAKLIGIPLALAADLFAQPVPMSKAYAALMAERGVESQIVANLNIKKVDAKEQIVSGEVYAPYVLDSHGEMMLPEDIKLLAHRFCIAQKNHYIDIMHNNKPIEASMVETFIARSGDPDYAEGAWVMSVKIFDANAWEDCESGKLNGYSLEAMVYKVMAEVVYDYLPLHFGFVEENDGHYHSFLVEVDKDGRVIGGYTSEAEDENGELHDHRILAGTATERSNKHGHRYFLNEIEA